MIFFLLLSAKDPFTISCIRPVPKATRPPTTKVSMTISTVAESTKSTTSARTTTTPSLTTTLPSTTATTSAVRQTSSGQPTSEFEFTNPERGSGTAGMSSVQPLGVDESHDDDGKKCSFYLSILFVILTGLCPIEWQFRLEIDLLFTHTEFHLPWSDST